tara:strand:+ start:1826 stop:2308 length:483 start_codon:yes stop_codon:yes gene_type:complete
MEKRLAACALALLVATATPNMALAQEEPYGGNIAGWSFTQDYDDRNGAMCKARRMAGGVEQTLVINEKGQHFLGISTPPGMSGTMSASLSLVDGPMSVPAYVRGRFLWFGPMDDWSFETLAQEGGAVAVIPSKNFSQEVDLGTSTTAVANNLYQCISNYS